MKKFLVMVVALMFAAPAFAGSAITYHGLSDGSCKVMQDGAEKASHKDPKVCASLKESLMEAQTEGVAPTTIAGSDGSSFTVYRVAKDVAWIGGGLVVGHLAGELLCGKSGKCKTISKIVGAAVGGYIAEAPASAPSGNIVSRVLSRDYRDYDDEAYGYRRSVYGRGCRYGYCETEDHVINQMHEATARAEAQRQFRRLNRAAGISD